MNKRLPLHIIQFILVCCSFQEIQASANFEFFNTEIVSDTLYIDTSEISPKNFVNLKEKYSDDDFVYERTIEKSGWWSRFKQWLSDKFQSLFNIKNAGQASKMTNLAIKIGGPALVGETLYQGAKHLMSLSGLGGR